MVESKTKLISTILLMLFLCEQTKGSVQGLPLLPMSMGVSGKYLTGPYLKPPVLDKSSEPLSLADSQGAKGVPGLGGFKGQMGWPGKAGAAGPDGPQGPQGKPGPQVSNKCHYHAVNPNEIWCEDGLNDKL